LIAGGKETKAGAAALLSVDAVTLRRAYKGANMAVWFTIRHSCTD